MINTYSLFCVNVFQSKIIVPIDIHKKILDFVEKNYKEENNISCVNGFQYHEDFNGKKELNKIINKHMFSIHHLSIIHGWLNVLRDQSYNQPHCHLGDNIKMAGVFYLSNENNNITFTSNGKIFEIKPKLFDYLIFPFDLLHYVLPEQRIKKRICYAFNLR